MRYTLLSSEDHPVYLTLRIPVHLVNLVDSFGFFGEKFLQSLVNNCVGSIGCSGKVSRHISQNLIETLLNLLSDLFFPLAHLLCMSFLHLSCSGLSFLSPLLDGFLVRVPVPGLLKNILNSVFDLFTSRLFIPASVVIVSITVIIALLVCSFAIKLATSHAIQSVHLAHQCLIIN